MNIRFLPDGVTYPADVDLAYPTENGWSEPRRIRVHYRMLKSSRAAELAADSNAAFMRAVVLDWEGVVDVDGNPVAATPEAIESAADLHFFAVAVVDGYFNRFDPKKN